MAKVRSQAGGSIRPASARHGRPDRSQTLRPERSPPPRSSRRREQTGTRGGWQTHFLGELADGGMEAACRMTAVEIGSAVSARVADSTFGQAVDRIGTERLATAEVMMIDLLLQRLAETRDDKEKDKAVLALWQALREDRRRPAGRPAVGGAQKQAAEKEAAASAGAGPADAATERAAELGRLIAAVEARLVAAEGDKG